MTIPDIGHCAGSGAEPAHGSIQTGGEQASTAVLRQVRVPSERFDEPARRRRNRPA